MLTPDAQNAREVERLRAAETKRRRDEALERARERPFCSCDTEAPLPPVDSNDLDALRELGLAFGRAALFIALLLIFVLVVL